VFDSSAHAAVNMAVCLTVQHMMQSIWLCVWQFSTCCSQYGCVFDSSAQSIWLCVWQFSTVNMAVCLTVQHSQYGCVFPFSLSTNLYLRTV